MYTYDSLRTFSSIAARSPLVLLGAVLACGTSVGADDVLTTTRDALLVCVNESGVPIEDATCDTPGGECLDANAQPIDGVCLEVSEEEECETAFAHSEASSRCFDELESTELKKPIRRWGWTNGPFTAGDYTLDLYAGAAKCDLSKGSRVGTMTVSYDGATATVTYEMSSGFTLDETHTYVGAEVLPRSEKGKLTVAPGQYPDVSEDLDAAAQHTATVTGVSGDVFVIGHAVVCGEFVNEEENEEENEEAEEPLE